MRRLAALLPLVFAAGSACAGDIPDAARRGQLVEMIRQDCGACHGLTLKGGLGPSLEPAAMQARDAEQLSFVILNGRHGTPMPPWRSQLTEGEARWIAGALKRGLPK